MEGESIMKYEQFYYSWVPSGISQYNKKGGYGIAASSNGNSDFLRKCESIALNKKPELTGVNRITEYFQYVESLKTYIFAGIYQIEAPEEMRGRDNSLAHVFVPAESVDVQNPSSYIRKMEYASIQRLEPGMDELPCRDISECRFDYQQLLEKYNLTDCSRLAVLLRMEFEGYFADSKRAIVFPLGETENFSETAREITWLLHSWVPDCLYKSAFELRQKLGYIVGGSTSNKNCLCFVPKNGEIEKNKQRFELQASSDCKDRKEIARGADFYYELAKRAQKSPQAVTEFIKEVCSLLPEVKSMNRILDAFECCQLRNLNGGERLPDWEAAGMKKKLERAKKNDILAKEYCIDYLIRANQFSRSFSLDSRQLKDCWDALAYDETGGRRKLEERFCPLVPAFLDMSYQFCAQSKGSDWKLYLDKLEVLEECDSKMWVEQLYHREGGCIHAHLERITGEEEEGEAVLEECLRCYGASLGGDSRFREEIFTKARELYRRNQNNSIARSRIDRCVHENRNVFDLARWEELVIELLPADSMDFCEKYQGLKSKALKTQWLEKASENIETIYHELEQAFDKMPAKRSKSFAEYRSNLCILCGSWLRLAANYRMAVNRKPVVDWEWIFEKLNQRKQNQGKQKDFYSCFIELTAGEDWTEDKRDIGAFANQLETYGELRRYLESGDGKAVENRQGTVGIGIDALEKYTSGYRKHVLEESRQKTLEILLARDAMILYERQSISVSERKRIRRCMEAIPSWEKEVDQKFRCATLEEFLKLPPDLEEDYPDRWDREYAKFAGLFANYNAVLRRRNGIGSRAEAERKREIGSRAEAERKREIGSGIERESNSGKSLSEVVKFQDITEKPKNRLGKKQAGSVKKSAGDEGNRVIMDFLNQ